MEVPIRMVALVVERRLDLRIVVVLHRVVNVVRAGVLHFTVGVVPLRHSALLPDQLRTNPTQGPPGSYDVLHFTRDRLCFIRCVCIGRQDHATKRPSIFSRCHEAC